MSKDELIAMIKDVISEDLSIEISTKEKSDYGYGGSTVSYVEVSVNLLLDGETIHSSTDYISLPSCQH